MGVIITLKLRRYHIANGLVLTWYEFFPTLFGNGGWRGGIVGKDGRNGEISVKGQKMIS